MGDFVKFVLVGGLEDACVSLKESVLEGEAGFGPCEEAVAGVSGSELVKKPIQ
jgi:hypothetical protein